MASMKPKLIGAISGEAMGVEFAVTRNGQVLKSPKPSRQMDSPAEMNALTVFSRRVSDWQSMTPESMREWKAYAETHPVTNRLGETIYLSAYNWFLKLRGTMDGTLLPTDRAPYPQLGFPRVYEGGPYEFTIYWQAESTDDWMVEYWICTWKSGIYTDSNAVFTSIGKFSKGAYPLNFYDIVTAHGIQFKKDQTYILMAQLSAPRLFPSIKLMTTFYMLEQGVWWYKMDDCSTYPEVHDSQLEYQQTLTDPSGDPRTIAHTATGIHGRALMFDGSDDTIILTPESWFDLFGFGTTFSLAMWWKPLITGVTPKMAIISNLQTGKGGFEFWFSHANTGLILQFKYGAHVYLESYVWDETWPPKWHHFAMTREGSTLSVYLDGVLKGERTADFIAGALNSAGNDLSIASCRGVTKFAFGLGDDFRLFDTCLTPAEIQELATP